MTEHIAHTRQRLMRIDYIIIGVIILIALLLRLYKIGTPLADFHSWRQADTAAVGRNFVKYGFDLLHPQYDDLSNTQSGQENPHGYRFVEFPLYNAVFALTYKLLPSTPIEVHGRLVTMAFSLMIIAILYYLSYREVGRIGAVTAALLYAIFPFFVFFSRVVLPETTAIALMFISIGLLYAWERAQNRTHSFLYASGSCICFAAALLVKPPVIFYGLVLFYLFVRTYKLSFIKRADVYIYFIVAAIPLLLWRYYITSYPEGIPGSSWLITSVNTYQGLQNIFLRPAFFRWIFFERINNIILGGYASAFLILGLLTRPRRYFVHTMIIAALLYLLVFEGGNVQHEYYQTMILPALALCVGLGVQTVANLRKEFIHPLLSTPAILIVFTLSFFFSYYHVKDYYNYSTDLPQIANVIKTLTHANDKIVTDSIGDTTLLFLADRRGAPAVYHELDELKKLGYSYIETTNKEAIANYKATGLYELIFENDKFALFRL